MASKIVKWIFHGLSLLICLISFILLLDGIFIFMGIFNFIVLEVIDRTFEDD